MQRRVYLPSRGGDGASDRFRTTDMTTYDNTRGRAGVGVFANLGAAISSLLAAIAAWNDARITRKALARLSDRELEDIGLSRGDIDAIR
jgi:uncharacterized protein YjiS (DUF1127 family)